MTEWGEQMLNESIGGITVLLEQLIAVQRRQAKAQEETARLLAIMAGAIGDMDNGLGTTIPALRVSTGY